MIPASTLHPRAVPTLMEYLTTEIRQVRSERAGLEQDWVRFQEIYRARMPREVPTFPFHGASRVTVQVAATDVDIFVAHMMGTLYASPNLWSSTAGKPEMTELAPRWQEFLQRMQESELGMYGQLKDWVTEVAKLGTGVLKQRYVREQKKVYEWRELPGGQRFEQQAMRLVRDTPEVRRVALADYYQPAGFATPKEAPWAGERLKLTMAQLEARQRAGIYMDVQRLGLWSQQPATHQGAFYDQALGRLQNFVPSRPSHYEILEFWLDFDIDGDGLREPIVATIHEPSNTLLRLDFNPFFTQEKPYSTARFIAVEGQFYGIGLCELYESIQDEVTAMHRQRLDGGTIRNAPVFKGRRGEIKSDTPIFPGAVLLMNSPADDLLPMFMGQSGTNDSISAEAFLLQYAKQRSGVSDYMAGGAGSSNMAYSAPTTTIEMLKQGRLKIDMSMRELRDALRETGRRVTELYAQFDQTRKLEAVLGAQDAMVVQQFLSLPIDVLREGLVIDVTATDAHLNKETQIRTNQIIYGMVLEFYGQLMQGLQIAVNPQVPPPLQAAAAQMIQGGTILMRRILDTYDVQDADQIIPNLRSLVTSGQQQLGALQGAIPGGAGMGLGPVQSSGMAGYGAGVAGPAGGSPQGPPQGERLATVLQGAGPM